MNIEKYYIKILHNMLCHRSHTSTPNDATWKFVLRFRFLWLFLRFFVNRGKVTTLFSGWRVKRIWKSLTVCANVVADIGPTAGQLRRALCFHETQTRGVLSDENGSWTVRWNAYSDGSFSLPSRTGKTLWFTEWIQRYIFQMNRRIWSYNELHRMFKFWLGMHQKIAS